MMLLKNKFKIIEIKKTYTLTVVKKSEYEEVLYEASISSVEASPPTERHCALTRRPHRTIRILMLK
jgi:hypothetical protein